jgi:hypothetical protein
VVVGIVVVVEVVVGGTVVVDSEAPVQAPMTRAITMS